MYFLQRMPHINIKKQSSYDKPNFGKTKGNIYFNNYRETTRFISGSWHLLVRWKGSVYRLVWCDLLIFLALYFTIALIYRAALIHYPIHKQHFELMCIYAARFSGAIPIALLTGFYVTAVVSRWWDQFMALPYPDKLALKLAAYVPGKVSLPNIKHIVYINIPITYLNIIIIYLTHVYQF